MKNRLHFIAPFIIIITFLLIGTFLDLNISKSFVSLGNGFDRFIAAFATVPFSVIFSICANFTILTAVKKYKKKKIKFICLCIITLLLFAVSFYCAGRFFIESYDLKKYFLIVFGICVSVPSFLLGFKLYKKFESPNLIRVLLLIVAVGLIAIIITEGLKRVAPRARYFYMASIDNFDLFRPWYMPNCEPLGDNSKSFPSGHANNAMLTLFCLMSIAYVKPEYKKYQIPLFYGGFIFYVFVSISRVHYGAHFVSDVSFSGLFNLCIIFIANEIFVRKLDTNSKELLTNNQNIQHL